MEGVIPRPRTSQEGRGTTPSGWEDVCAGTTALYAHTTPDHEIPQVEGYHPEVQDISEVEIPMIPSERMHVRVQLHCSTSMHHGILVSEG